ncbi:MAG: flagellar hook-length control protein FliK [Nitrospirae bacterium]|nr:flagellar hook-length control protein FliK [Nitrospirota bacterium]
MNELLTLNLKPGAAEAAPNQSLKQPKNPLKGENFSSQLKSQMAKRDAAKNDEHMEETSSVKKEEKPNVKKSEQRSKTKERRDKDVSEKKKSDNDDKNTDQVLAAGVKNERPQDDTQGASYYDSSKTSTDDQDSTESLDKFLQDYLNITDQQDAFNPTFTMDDKTQGFSSTDSNPAMDMMMDLSALDMHEDLPDNLFEDLTNNFSENPLDKSGDDLDANQLDKLFDKLNQKASVEKTDLAKPEIEQSSRDEKTSDTPFIEVVKTVSIEQNFAVKSVQKDEQQINGVNSTDTNNMAGNLSMKVDSGRELSNIKTVPSTPEPPRVFFVNENKFIITKHGDNKVEVTLEPNGIGKLRIEVNHEKGIIHTTISASEASGKEIIEKNINRIMEELSKEGINIGEFSVNLKERHDQTSDDSKRSAHNDINDIDKSSQDITAPVGQRHINNNGRLSIFI